jgi:hypothetical protein
MRALGSWLNAKRLAIAISVFIAVAGCRALLANLIDDYWDYLPSWFGSAFERFLICCLGFLLTSGVGSTSPTQSSTI